ncbi:hypothetical protein V499_03976 [Pseudogymnoascus sp. VKM F-103]|nr:hypothetical protein V499_03976 [Pseudogymnoascus sp. VKM F-103]
MTLMGCLNDDTFGPVVQGCRDDFDFTQKFERILFTAVPASAFILVAIVRVSHLAQKPRLVLATPFQLVKILTIIIYAASQLSLLVLLSIVDAAAVRSFSIAGIALAFTASLLMIAVSFLEHARSHRTSALLNIYLLFTLLFDIVQARTLWLVINSRSQAIFTYLFTASIAIKLIVLVLETHSKARWIIWDEKEHSPEETSGIYTLSVYYWLKQLFLRGYKSILRFDDLYGLDSAMSAETTASKLIEKLNDQKHHGQKPSLLKALFRAFSWPFLLPVFPQIALIAFQYSQSFFLEALIEYLERPDHESSKNMGYGLIVACALIYLGMTVSTSFYAYHSQRAASMARGSLCAVIYKKTTEITTATATDTASVTLMSTDVQHVETGIRLMHFMWSSLIQVGLGCWLLYTKLGVSFVAPIVIMCLCSGILLWVMTFVQSRQSVWMGKIESRVGLTANVISNMKYFKMLGISDHVADLIQDLREEEIRAGTKFRILLLAAFGLGYIPLSISPAVTFGLTFRNLDASTLFVSLSFMTLLTTPLLQLFQDLPQCLAALTSLHRIEAYLAKQPWEDFRHRDAPGASEGQVIDDHKSWTSETALVELHRPDLTHAARHQAGVLPSSQEPAFEIENGSFGWDESKMVLKDIDIAFPSGKMSIIVGPIASGKSTLCKVLLGEVPIACGSTKIKFPNSPIGYCAQTPFLLDATIMENIISYSRFDQKKYDAIITATMLSVDVANLPSGHHTKIGSNGILLSGGQKQRVSLARALYLESEVLIFDDVFSGLDAPTETEVFKRVFGPDGIIQQRRATSILFTHSVRHLPFADYVVVLGSDGGVVEQGPFDTLANNGKYVSSLGVTTTTPDTNRVSKAEDIPKVSIQRKTLLEMNNANQYRQTGDWSIYAHNLCRDSVFGGALNLNFLIPEELPEVSIQHKAPLEMNDADQSRQAGDWSIYIHYLRNVATRSVAACIILCIVSGTAANFSTVWASFWSENSFDRPTNFYVGLYGSIRALELFSILGAVVGLVHMVSSSGSNLHRQAIITVVRAPLSFFTTTDTGTVTNLFSQDMTLIDGELPLAFINTFLGVVILIGNCFVAAIASPYLAISYPFVAGILYVIQVFYLRTSRQLRLLDLEAKSPLYNHFIDTTRDLATIRAFGWVKDEIDTSNKFLNASQRPAYLLAMIQAWLQTNLTMLVGVIAICLTTLATQLRTSSSFTGASLLTLMSLASTVAAVMQSYTQLETSIGAINRLRTFSQKVKPEDGNDANMPIPELWPTYGSVSLNAVSASYSTKAADADDKSTGKSPQALALNNLSLYIRPGEKVAVCGRTGSGKSSLMLLLLRLLDPLPGSENIEVDGIPIHQVHRSTLRQRFITVPQDSIFLPGVSSIKFNLDTLSSATDEECISVLETVQLSSFVRACGGLHAPMSADSLSAGQQQLFGLGRAVLRRILRDKMGGPRGGILLLDEMNSKLDKDTDRITQEIVREHFADYTVIMVAHRLDIVMNMCDRVFVLDKGTLVEEGSPKMLAATSESRFGELWKEDA